MTYDVVDFRKPTHVPEDIGNMLSVWQNSAREAIELRLGRSVSNQIKIGLLPPTTLTGSGLRELDQASVIYRVDVADTGPTLIVFFRPLALTLVSEMLGDAVEEQPEDRPLTDIENTCMDFLVEEFKSALDASQRLSPARRLSIIGQANLGELHTQFPERMTNTEVGFQVDLPSGTESIRWILPQEVTLDMVTSFAGTDAASSEARQALEQSVLGTTAELSIALGSTHLKISQLAKLAPGDVVVLNQPLNEPLCATLGGEQLFSGWAGRIGRQQAFQISDLTGSTGST